MIKAPKSDEKNKIVHNVMFETYEITGIFLSWKMAYGSDKDITRC